MVTQKKRGMGVLALILLWNLKVALIYNSETWKLATKFKSWVEKEKLALAR